MRKVLKNKQGTLTSEFQIGKQNNNARSSALSVTLLSTRLKYVYNPITTFFGYVCF